MAYLLQLMSPWFLLCASMVLASVRYGPWLLTAVLLLSLGTYQHAFHWTPQQQQAWEEVRQLVRGHQRVLNSPLEVSFLVEEGKEIYDNGAIQWSLEGVRPIKGTGFFLKPDVPLYVQNARFFEGINQKIMAREFDLLLINPQLTRFNFPAIQARYYLYREYFLGIPHFNANFQLLALVPKEG